MPKITSFSLTHVEYEKGDVVGFLCAGLSLAPVFAVVANVAVILARREFIAIVALIGQIANTLFNLVLKDYIDAQRPPGCHLKGPGMPSNHAQFVFFTAAFWSLHAYNTRSVYFNQQPHITVFGRRIGHSQVLRNIIAFGLVATATAVAGARVYLGYHYANQVCPHSAYPVHACMVHRTDQQTHHTVHAHIYWC